MHTKQKAPIGAFFIILVVLEVFFFLLSGVFNIPDVNLFNLQESIYYAFTHPLAAWNDRTLAMMSVGLLIWAFMITWYIQFHRNYHSEMHGSASWRDVHEANKFYADKKGNNRRLSQNLEVSLEGKLANNNMIICATSGDFKTTGVVEVNLLKFLSTYIVLDVKGELQRKWGNAFKRAGYKVQSLNFHEPAKSDRYNPFVYIEREDDVLRMVDTLFNACRPMDQFKKGAAADPFWDDAVKLVFQSGISSVWLEGKRNNRPGTMNRLIELFNMESKKVYVEETDEIKSELQIYMDDLAERYGSDYPPVRDYRKLKDGAPDTVRSVFLMVYAMLAPCETAEMKRIFEDNDINIRELGLGVNNDPNKKTVLFLELPPNNHAYDFAINLFYNQCFDILERTADLEVGGPLPVRVEFWMDEFYTGPKPMNVPELLGIVRGWNISMVLILQDFAQLEDLYPGKKFEIVLNNVAVVVFMGSGPMVTSGQKMISETIGKATFDVQSDNLHMGNNGHAAYNWNQGGRELMLPDEVKDLSPTDLIIFIKSSKPIIDTKAIPFDKEEYDYIAPKWLKEPYAEMLSLGKYEHPVYTIYDEEHFHYITVKREEPMQIVTNAKDIKALQEVAEKNPDIYTYNVDEDELLYLSWGAAAYTQESVVDMYKKAMEDAEFRKERLEGLIVLQNVDGTNVPNFGTNLKLTDKSGWDKYSTFKSLIAAHWDDLSLPEQEEIGIGIDEGLTEEQLRMLMLLSLSEMAALRQAFTIENRRRG